MIAFDGQNDAHVAVLVKWWGDLPAEDRAKTFHPSLFKLGAFLRYFNDGHGHLLFTIDEQGIVVAAWTEPIWDAATFGLWVRPDKRHAPSAWKAVREAYDLALSVYPTLIGYTRQAGLHAEHTKLGYEYGGRLNGVFADGPVWVYVLTKENWLDRSTLAQRFRVAKREQRHGNPRLNQQRNEHADDDQPLRERPGEIREAGRADGATASQHDLIADAGSAQNGRG